MVSILSDRERELSSEIANRAMIAGWDRAIGWAASQYGISQIDVKILLDKAARYNNEADPSGRIDELDDWVKERRGRSERSQSSKLHKLSPGLRAYMLAKKDKANAEQTQRKS